MENERQTLIIAIDFGTSTTVIKYKYAGQAPEFIKTVSDPVDSKIVTIPSVIFYPANGADPYCGQRALQANDSRKKGILEQNMKLGLKYQPESNEYLTKLPILRDYFKFVFKRIEEDVLHSEAYDDIIVYLSVPAKWTNTSRDMMRREFMDAGFEALNDPGHKVVVEIVDEPTAAMHYLLSREAKHLMMSGILKPNHKANCLLLDMGAGTSDIVMFQAGVSDDGSGNTRLDNPVNVLNYPNSDNPNLCGGSELDEQFQQYLHNKIFLHFGEVVPNWSRTCNMQVVKTWKENSLSEGLKVDGECDTLPMTLDTALGAYFPDDARYDQFLDNFNISRSLFEHETMAHWKRLNSLITGAIAEYQSKYGVGAADIDIVLLTGGHAGWYCVRNLFDGTGIGSKIGTGNGFTKIAADPQNRILQGNKPSESVAEGLCMQDLGYEIPHTATNNIFVELIIDGRSNGPVQVVKAGEELPCQVESIETPPLSVTKDLFESHIFKVTMNIYEGVEPTPQNCSTTELVYNSSDSDVNLGRSIVALIPILWFGDWIANFKFKARMKVEVRKDQCIYLDGELLVDGRSRMKFNEKNFSKPQPTPTRSSENNKTPEA